MPTEAYYLPPLHQPSNSCSSLIAPLIPCGHERSAHLRALLLDLRHHLNGDVNSETLSVLLIAVCEALCDVDQDTALHAAACPWRTLDPHEALIADKRAAAGEYVGDQTMTATMLLPLLSRACRADNSDELVDRLGVLASSLSGHGEHTLRIGLGETLPPLQLRVEPAGLCTGTRLWPVARLAIGACASGWAGLRVEGGRVLEIGCGAAAVGCACAS